MGRNIVLLGVAAAGVILLAVRIATWPPLPKEKLVEIPKGSSAREVAAILKREHIIRRESWFLFLTNRRKVQEKLQAGIYEFTGRTKLGDVVDKLVKGQTAFRKVTIPEGATVSEIVRILQSEQLVTRESFADAAGGRSLEGYLFPDTYCFPVRVDARTVINTMLEQFRKEMEVILGAPLASRTQEDVRKIVTVASIVEKEAEIDEERPIIASVIYNRLKRNMALQCCSTVEYALGFRRQRLTGEDLRIDSPYNTYRHRGLPPTPICNPGRNSLRAAAFPSQTSYLYFVTRGDRTHQFSRTWREHDAAVSRYLSGQREGSAAQ